MVVAVEYACSGSGRGKTPLTGKINKICNI